MVVGGADHYRALHPGYQPGCQQWHHGSPIFPHFSPCPTGALACDRLTVMSWSCWCASVCTKAVVSQMCNEPVTTAGSSSMLRVLRCPCLRNEQRCYRTCSSPKGIAFRLFSKNHNNLLFQPLEFTETLLASDLIDLSSTSVGLLVTQT